MRRAIERSEVEPRTADRARGHLRSAQALLGNGSCTARKRELALDRLATAEATLHGAD